MSRISKYKQTFFDSSKNYDPLGIMKIGGILCGCGKIRCAKIGCEISFRIESWKSFLFISCRNFLVASVKIGRTILLQVRKLDAQIYCRFESC